jgi:tRNA (mo5U34)-methyltransferase
MNRGQIERKVRDLGQWFHNIDLDGVPTAPNHFLGDYPNLKWQRFAHSIPSDLSGSSVLDIGCNGGFYCLEMKRRGASRVLGIDSDETYLAQARFAAEVYGASIEFRRMSVYGIGALKEKFDLVLFMGLLYHLRYPLLALDLINEHVVRDRLVFQCLLRGSKDVARLEPDYPISEVSIFDRPDFPRMHFIENCYSSDQTNWWIPNRAAAEAMLRSSGFVILDHPEEEVYICARRGQ